MDSPGNAKILVVDDSSVNNFLLENVLEEKGYTLQVAYNGKEALHFIENDPPDLVLLDIMMPGIDGYEILQKMNASSKTSGIPVIMVTSKSEESDRTKALEIGAVDYVMKPIDIEELLEKVEDVINKK
jgi:DNA-binding response OmpR family regulator